MNVKKKVLIIEDDLTIQHIVTYILKSEGYEVIGIQHQPAFELQRYPADLILLDEWINRQEGHMLCKEIKALEVFKNTKVIIFSTAPNIADIVKTCKADGFINKPFDLDILVAEIRKQLDTPMELV